MGCNCGRNKKKKRSSGSSPKVEVSDMKFPTITDEQIDSIISLMLNRVTFHEAVVEIGIDKKSNRNYIYAEVEKKLGKEQINMLKFLARFELLNKRIGNTENIDLINAAIANCEDVLIRLKQRKVELE